MRKLFPWLSPATTPTSLIYGGHWVTSRFRRNSQPHFPPPTPQLPLAELEPEVLERLAAEFVAWRSNSTKVHFYGRRGQTQYGLDIVEHLGEARPTLYQVRRLQSLQANDITGAVRDYAGDPHPHQPRRFDQTSFVLITSGEFDSDTANVDALDALNVEYGRSRGGGVGSGDAFA